MGRMYTCPIVAAASAVAVDFWEITAGSTRPCLVHSVKLSQHTELSDAGEEGLQILFKRGQGTTSGTTGVTAAGTPVPLNGNDAAATALYDTMNTVKQTGGTITTMRAYAWNVRIPFYEIFTPEERPVILPTERFVVELVAAPTDSVTYSGTVVIEEIG